MHTYMHTQLHSIVQSFCISQYLSLASRFVCANKFTITVSVRYIHYDKLS